jgi:hypothetical protein
MIGLARSLGSSVVMLAFLAGCGTTTRPVAALHSPSAATSSSGASPAASPPAGVKPSPTPGDPRLVIADYVKTEVRLARLDASDTATVKGDFQGIAGGQVILLNGRALMALGPDGTVKQLGQIVENPESVVVKPDLSQWLYMALGSDGFYRIHLGSPGGDRVVETNPSPTQDQIFRPYAWNVTGTYVTREPLGLGGAGPFLEYHFPLAKLDLASGQVTDIAPSCVAYSVLDDGTMICGNRTAGTIELRPPTGSSSTIHLGTDTYSFIRLVVSPDGKRVILGRNGANAPVINYQMAVADLTSANASAFGPIDYLPDTWLPDGRVVATHQCVISDWGGGPCNTSLDGTYFFSPDGTSHALFFKLASGVRVVGYV